MRIRNALLISGIALLSGCAHLKNIASAAETDRDRLQREEERQVRIVEEEAKKIADEIKSGKLVWALDLVNYETCEVETNYYQPPAITEKIGRVDVDYVHAWNEFYSGTNEYYVSPQRGVVIEKSSITNKFYDPTLEFSPERLKKFENLRKSLGDENFPTPDKVPINKRKPFGKKIK